MGTVLKYFTGSTTHRVDAKGRVSLPAEFRKVLEALGSTHVVVLPQLHHSDAHTVYSQTGYENLVSQLEDQDMAFEQQEVMALRYVTNARSIQVDEVGRIVLSKDLRERIGVTDEVRFVGHMTEFQLWEPGRRDAFEARIGDGSMEVAKTFRPRKLHG